MVSVCYKHHTETIYKHKNIGDMERTIPHSYIYFNIRFILRIIYIMAYCLKAVKKGVSRNDP